jgi:hypothetical protein
MSETLFTPQQITALDALVNGATITEAAAQAGVHRNTIGNWRRETTYFEIALTEALYDRALLYREKAEAMADLAFDTIRTILADPKASPSVRLRAALAIVNTLQTQPDPQKRVKITMEELLMTPTKVPKPAQQPDPPPTLTIRHTHPQPGRNELCPCGSGQKYKRCCLNKPVEQPVSKAA